jgi:hypothetical protein
VAQSFKSFLSYSFLDSAAVGDLVLAYAADYTLFPIVDFV